MEELEPRELLSADFAPLPVEPAPLPASPLHQAITSTPTYASTAAQYTGTLELVFLDPRVPDSASLLADLQASGRHLQIITLDANRNGIEQVTEALAGRMQVDAIHFITHGTDAAVQLGGSWLNAKTVAANAGAVAGWGHALKADGDLLFYGCDLAGSARGRALMDWIAELTQADVAASTDKTGAESVGANWTLEYQHGQIDARVAITTDEQAQWQGMLAAPIAANDSYTVAEDGSTNVGWWDLEWTQRQQIAFTGNIGAGAETLTNFPVLVTLNSSDIDYNQTQNDGGDLRFFDADGTPLAYEVERWDETGNSYVWVKVPQIDATGSDYMWMYYGNAAAPDGQNPTAVWSGNGYSAVYHLDEAGPAINDATANSFDGTALNGTAGTPGQIAGAQTFDGTNDRIDLGTNRAFLNGASGATFSAWINPDIVSASGVILTAGVNSGMPTARVALERQGDEIRVIVRSDDNNPPTSVQTDSANLQAAGGWYYVSGTVDLVANTVSIYVNGVPQTLQNTASLGNLRGTAFPATSSASSQIGANDVGPTAFFDGQIDEARIATVARSSGWVLAEYRTMNSPSTFVTMSGPQTAPTAPAIAGVLDNDTDADGNTLTAVLVSGASHGALTLNANGTFNYTPNADFYGTDAFTYRANDGALDSTIATVTITVIPAVDTAADSASTNQDVPLTVNVLANDSFENPGRAVTVVTNGANGTVTIVDGALGTVQYTPSANFSGSDAFTYTVTSGGATETAAVSINVTPLNDAPAGTNNSVTILEEATYTFAAADFGFTDPNDAPANNLAAVIITTTPGAGTLQLAGVNVNPGDVIAAANLGNLTFTPAANASGNNYASFTFQVQDDGGTANGGANTDASPNTFTFNVTPLNDAPAAVANMGTTNEDTVLNVAAAGVLGNDTDPDSGDVLLVAAVNGNAANVGNSIALASGALLQVNADGSYSYDPNGAFNSLAAGVTTTDSFTYTASDGNGGTDSATVTITITGVNDAPTLTANNLTITNGATITLTLSNLGASDPDNVWADLSYSVSGVTNGQFELTSAPGVAVTTFTQGDVAAGFVVFVHAGNSLAPAYTIKAFDGALSSTASGATVNFTRSDPTLPPSPPSASGSSRDTTVAPPSEPPPASNPSRSTGDDTASPLDGPAPVPRSSGAEVIAIPEPEVAAPVAYAAERVIAEKLKIIEPKIEPMTMISEAPTVVGTEQSFRPEFVQTRSQEITVDLGHIVLKEQDGDRLIRIDLNALRMASLALTIGAVLWATRATGLLACLLSSLPAWRNFDPLPVLARDEDEEREDEWVKAHDAHADEDAEREESALNHTFSNRDSQPVEVEKVRSQLRG